jgi:hypothetical protein
MPGLLGFDKLKQLPKRRRPCGGVDNSASQLGKSVNGRVRGALKGKDGVTTQ